MTEGHQLATLLSRANELEAELSAAVAAQQESSGDESPLSYAALRLQRSVIRPLEEALERSAAEELDPPKPRAREGRRGDVGPPSGSMPCDGAWPQEKIDAFERWVTTGASH